MEKAILVMDMPDSCAKCPFVLHEDEGWLYCSIHNSDTAYAFQRADYCPLKPMEHIVARLEEKRNSYHDDGSVMDFRIRAAYNNAIEIVKAELNKTDI